LAWLLHADKAPRASEGVSEWHHGAAIEVLFGTAC